MTIARGLRLWAVTGLALITVAACGASVAGVAQSAPGAGRSAAPPVPISGSSTATNSTAASSTASSTATRTATTSTTSSTARTSTTSSTARTSTTSSTATTSTRSTVPSTSRGSTSPRPTATEGAATARLTGSGAIVVSRGTPKTTVDVFEEPYCPPCAVFSRQNRTQLDAAVADGRIALRLRVVTFLDPKSPSGDYSTRALSALLAVAGIDGDRPGVFLAFQNALFDPANQPKEGAAKDLTAAQLAALAAKVGVSRSAIAAFGTDSMGTIAVQASAANQAALGKLGANAVPTVAVDDKVVDHRETDWLARALGR